MTKPDCGQRVQLSRLRVVPSVRSRTRGFLIAGQSCFACAIGRGGFIMAKREGDGGTPMAALPLRRIFWRADKVPRLRSLLRTRQTTRRDAWCDDQTDRRYNRLIDRPPGAAEERLWRDDHLYDLIVELGWNDRPVKKGGGSAIFWHLPRPGLTATAGCVATPLAVFRKVLPRLCAGAVLITGQPKARPISRAPRKWRCQP